MKTFPSRPFTQEFLWQQFNMNRIRLREPPELDFPSEQPALMAKLISLHTNELGYSVSDLSKFLAMHEEELVAFHEKKETSSTPGRPKLRIVT